jgi:hypothetical protein
MASRNAIFMAIRAHDRNIISRKNLRFAVLILTYVLTCTSSHSIDLSTIRAFQSPSPIKASSRFWRAA